MWKCLSLVFKWSHIQMVWNQNLRNVSKQLNCEYSYLCVQIQEHKVIYIRTGICIKYLCNYMYLQFINIFYLLIYIILNINRHTKNLIDLCCEGAPLWAGLSQHMSARSVPAFTELTEVVELSVALQFLAQKCSSGFPSTNLSSFPVLNFMPQQHAT